MVAWAPHDISGLCLQEQAPLTQCSATGYMFLSLVTQLFSATSYSISYTGADLYPGDDQMRSYLNIPFDQPSSNEDTKRVRRDYQSEPGYELVDDQQMTNPEKDEEASRMKRQIDEYYDFIIVGAGSAGCVLAHRLSEVRGWKILLIEAGSEEPDVTMVPNFAPLLKESSIDWMYRTQPEELTCRAYKGQTCYWPRGKTMGGSSAINYIIYMRGNKLDYNGWAELGNPGWSYDEVLPYFKKAENNRNIEGNDTKYHGVGGPLNVERYPYTDEDTLMLIEAFHERGLPIKDLTLPDNIGVTLAQSTSKDGRRFSANLAYIRPIRNVRPNLTIIKNAFVTKLIIDSNTKVAQGLIYFKDNKYKNVYATKEVIVSAGALNSPKLLMLSGIGPKEDLQKLNIPVLADLKVGHNLQDHVTTEGLSIVFSNKTSSSLLSDSELLGLVNDYRKQDPYSYGPLSTTSTLNAIAFIKTKYSPVNAPDIQYHFDARDVNEFNADPQTYIPTNIFPLCYRNGLGVRTLLLTPQSRGKVALNQTDPVFGQPLLYSGFFQVKNDLDTLVEGMRFALTLEETEAFKRSGARIDRTPLKGCEGFEWGSYDYFVCMYVQYTAVIFHPVGTCKMGPSRDKDAVVDSRLRVYGIKNLRVVDASIMPKIIRGNTNAPVIMIAEKTSDMIKEDWGCISSTDCEK